MLNYLLRIRLVVRNYNKKRIDYVNMMVKTPDYDTNAASSDIDGQTVQESDSESESGSELERNFAEKSALEDDCQGGDSASGLGSQSYLPARAPMMSDIQRSPDCHGQEFLAEPKSYTSGSDSDWDVDQVDHHNELIVRRRCEAWKSVSRPNQGPASHSPARPPSILLAIKSLLGEGSRSNLKTPDLESAINLQLEGTVVCRVQPKWKDAIIAVDTSDLKRFRPGGWLSGPLIDVLNLWLDRLNPCPGLGRIFIAPSDFFQVIDPGSSVTGNWNKDEMELRMTRGVDFDQVEKVSFAQASHPHQCACVSGHYCQPQRTLTNAPLGLAYVSP